MSGAKALFRATKQKLGRLPGEVPLIGGLEDQLAPVREQDIRDPLDFDPTPPTATWAFLAAEGDRLREIGGPIWENAVGAGHIAGVLMEAGFDVVGSDIEDRGWPNTIRSDFAEMQHRPLLHDIVVTNPPYNLVNARDGKGFWLTHTLDLGVRYCAMLLNASWPFASTLDPILSKYPFSRYYVCRWKIDFRGEGSPPQNNAWIVWDLDGPDPHGQRMLFLDRKDPRQAELL